MSIIKDAIDRIVQLATPLTVQVGKETYASKDLTLIEPNIDRPPCTAFSSLDGIVQAIHVELGRYTTPIFINVRHHNDVVVFTTYRTDNQQRDTLYKAAPELPKPFNEWNDHQGAVIALQSQFIPNEGSEYILRLISKYRDENSVQSDDNGVTQQVTVQKGISMVGNEVVKPVVALKPYRTFLEVDQPESDFLLRMEAGDKEKGKEPMIGILEADGGSWKLTAKKNVADYFRAELAEQVKACKVIVTE